MSVGTRELAALEQLSSGFVEYPANIPGSGKATWKRLEETGLVKFSIDPNSQERMVQITDAGQKIYNWAIS